MFVDSVPYWSSMSHSCTEEQMMNLADERRFLIHAVRNLKQHLQSEQGGAEVALGCIVRNRLVRYMAMAIKADVRFNISQGVRLTAHLDTIIERLQIKIATKEV